MPRAPRGKRVLDAVSGSYTVVGRAPNGEPEPYFDRSRGVWVAPWRKPDGKVGRPTGKTRAAAVASRNRHIAAAEEAARCGPLAAGFSAATTLAELGAWWFENVARHRVRPTTLSTYRKQWRLIAADLGSTPVRQLRTEQVAAFVSRMVDRGAASRAANIRTLLVQVLDEAVSLGLAETNVAKKVRRPKVPKVTRPTLTAVEVVKLLDACDERFVAVVAFGYLHGWRVSEALGLAWQDLDLEAPVASRSVPLGVAPCSHLSTAIQRDHVAVPSLTDLRNRRGEIIELARARGASRVRVFGSVARGDATEASDIDFLVDLDEGRNLLDLGGLLMDLRHLLGHDVDVAVESRLRPRVVGSVLADAVDL